MSTLAQVLDAVGPPVADITVQVAPRGLDVVVSGLSIHDPADPGACAPGDLVAVVGASPGAAPLPALRAAAADGASAVLLKAAGPLDPAALAVAREGGVAVLSVPPGTSWTRILGWLRSAAGEEVPDTALEPLGGLLTGDLVALANAISALMDAPVTIEDPRLRVLAFSRRQDDADPARLGTILGHQTPNALLERMRERGILRRLAASDRPLYLRGMPPDILPRVVAPVRAGDELLGSIWVVVRARPPRARMEALRDAASAASLHLLRHRLSSDARREVRSELLAAVLDGAPTAVEAARRLPVQLPCVAVAVGTESEAEDVVALSRTWELLQLHLSAVHRAAQTGIHGTAVAGLVPVASGAGASVVRTMERFVERAGSVVAPRLRVGISGVVGELAAVPAAWREAERTLVAARRLGDRAPAVARVDDAWLAALLLRVDAEGGPELAAAARTVGRLRAWDDENGTRLCETVDAWIRHFGDTAAVARELGVHDNTIRFRMRSLPRTGLADLGDPDVRLGLALEFRRRSLTDRG